MDPETFLTPRKIFQNAFNAARKSASGSGSPSVFTPTRLASRGGAVNGRFHLLPAVVQTPPSCRVLPTKVVNPFESLERLHLPMIASPSIFHRPATPRASSGAGTGDGSGGTAVFEWTIDEVSSLGQANFEPYESQFLQTPDTAREAKAQAAISAYFNEISVPSPVDCPLRNQKIILNGADSSSFSGSFAGRKSKRKRDGICQTVLTFPPVLPPEVEAMLAPYFNFHDNQQQTHDPIDETDGSFIDHDARDASLRRKLFNCASDSEEPEDREDSLDRLDLRCLSPPPVSPELGQASAQILKRSRCFSSSRELAIDPGDISLSPVAGTPSTQAGDDRESFGALSPISKRSESPSPMKPGSNSTELPSVEGEASGSGGIEMGTDAIYRSTPERPRPAGLVAMNCSSTNSQHHMSVELNDSQHRVFKPIDRSADLTEEDDVSYEDNLLASSQSSSSISTSQQHPTTPVRRHAGRSRSHRRNRKNLSHSFLLYSDELDEEREEQHAQSHLHQDLLTKELHRRSFSGILAASGKENVRPTATESGLAKSVPIGGNFYRMDSGFNEEETTRGSQETAEYDETDVSMQSDFCCDEAGTPQRGAGQRRALAAGAGDGQHHVGCSIRL
ncbi:protein aurora borealis [Culex quinquefasciatus]|uniref:protein aurora borealis n=1 Tax=Culex quinquefasciatus TaxID=7176 RepID=UPI0018E2EDEC|nr:protein aurora borealis [Culex quinquefasciatus]